MQKLIQEYEQSEIILYERIEQLQREAASAKGGAKVALYNRARRLRALHLQLHQVLAEMRAGTRGMPTPTEEETSCKT